MVFPYCVCSVPLTESSTCDVREYFDKYVGSHCQFNWTNRAKMIEKVRDRMKYRQKLFLRFNAPVYYLDSNWTWKRSPSEFDTWVWVPVTHKYMLHFPHNFNVLSLGTMGIITNNFEGPGGEGKILGNCSKCFLDSGKITKPRCVLTWKDISEFMSDVTAEDKTEWNYICYQVNYDVSNVIQDTNSAIPDLFYYWRFLSQLFTNRPYFGVGVKKDDFIHYNCFDKSGQLKRKELLMKYFVILIIAILLWLYSPLLIYFFPSSEPTWVNYPACLTPREFHCTSKSPVNFGNLMRCLLGYYIGKQGTMKSRLRRLLFISSTFVLSFRMFFTEYRSAFVCFMVVCLVTAVIPDFWSVHLANEQPKQFMNIKFLKYPVGCFRRNTTKKEYQLLAHLMKERLCLLLDLRFLKMLFSQSWRSFAYTDTWAPIFAKFPWIVRKIIILTCASLVSLAANAFFVTSLALYYLIPAFYFYKEIFFAMTNATTSSLLPALLACNSLVFYGCCALILTIFVCNLLLVVYLMVAMMFVCYFIAEVTMFTYIGAVLVPSMAFEYISLVGAVSLILYQLIKDMREEYDDLRDQIVEILEKADDLSHLNKAFQTGAEDTFERKEEQDGTVKALLKVTGEPSKVLVYRDHYDTYLSRPLLDCCIEECEPLRRKVALMIVKVVLMTFYLLTAMWIKNVFHKEEEVSSIFSIAQTIAMYFVPNLFQFFVDKNRFGKKNSVHLHRDVDKAIIAFVRRQ